MHNAFRNAGKLNEEIRKKIDEIVDKCEICKMNGCSTSKPTVAIPRLQISIQWSNRFEDSWRQVHIMDGLRMHEVYLRKSTE